MPRVQVKSKTYKLGKWTFKQGNQIGVTDEEYRKNKDKLEFLAPTSDRRINKDTGRIEEVIRPDSKP
ncbi:MAG: hypothetical protein ACE5E0_03450 [Terriglobia bacterium]